MDKDKDARAREEIPTCTWHYSLDCMANGWLELILHPVASDAVGHGAFCSIHSLYSWTEKVGAMSTPPSAMTQKRPGGGRKTREQRPTVPTRQPRRSLKPGGSK